MASPQEAVHLAIEVARRRASRSQRADRLEPLGCAAPEALIGLGSAGIEGHGLALRSVGAKDVILPGEMKTILNQVVEAEKVAQANLIRRREETAATRSLLNTARLMDVSCG